MVGPDPTTQAAWDQTPRRPKQGSGGRPKQGSGAKLSGAGVWGHEGRPKQGSGVW